MTCATRKPSPLVATCASITTANNPISPSTAGNQYRCSWCKMWNTWTKGRRTRTARRNKNTGTVKATMKFLLLIFKNLLRNKVRTILTCLATMVLVFVVTMIWTVVYFLNDLTEKKTKNRQAIITEKWQIPSQMPMSYAQPLSEGAASHPGILRPKESM